MSHLALVVHGAYVPHTQHVPHAKNTPHVVISYLKLHVHFSQCRSVWEITVEVTWDLSGIVSDMRDVTHVPEPLTDMELDTAVAPGDFFSSSG